jgi:hypothetical protein
VGIDVAPAEPPIYVVLAATAAANAVDRPEHAQLASNLCEKSAASRTLESFGIDYRGSAKRT